MLIPNEIARVYIYYIRKFILTRYLKGDLQRILTTASRLLFALGWHFMPRDSEFLGN